MNIFALPAAHAFTMNLTLCLIVLSFATWNLGEVVMISSLNPVHAILGVKVIFAGLTFAPLFFLHFSFVFPVRRQELPSRSLFRWERKDKIRNEENHSHCRR